MAEFGGQGAENPPIRAPWFDAEESVTLRPLLTYFMVMSARRKAMQMALDAEGLTRADFDAMDPGEAADLMNRHMVDDTLIDRLTLLGMIEAWTLRDAAGTVVPLDLEHVSQLSPRTGAFLAEEVQRRGAPAPVPQTEGGDFRRSGEDGGEGTLPAPGQPRGVGGHQRGRSHRQDGVDPPRTGRRAVSPRAAPADGVGRPGGGPAGDGAPDGRALAAAQSE